MRSPSRRLGVVLLTVMGLTTLIFFQPLLGITPGAIAAAPSAAQADTPIAGLQATSSSPTALGALTVLSATVSAGTNISYTWNLGDGTLASGPVVSHTYPAIGVYPVVVTATNTANQHTASTEVEISLAALEMAPTSFEETLFANTTRDLSLTITNTGSSALDFVFSGSGALEDVLDTLNTEYPSIISTIPNRYNFSDGIIGTSIGDGGNDMYDNGNILSTPLGGPLAYSDNTILESPIFGSGGRYFTRKYPGFFVLVADMNGVANFDINGNLGADGNGFVQGAVLETSVAGITYLGFLKRVYGAGDPSVNQLVIVTKRPGITHEFASDTDNGYHRVSGLNGTNRLYYLLYAGSNGLHINNSQALTIMNAFLQTLQPTSWLGISTSSGSLAPGTSGQVTFTLDATGLTSDTYFVEVPIESNAPATPIVQLPITMHVVDSAITGLSASNGSPTELGQTTVLMASATGSNISYVWDFGDGLSGIGPNVNHIYPAVGSYTATVTASNTASVQATTTTVTIIDEAISGLDISGDMPTPIGYTTFLTATVGTGSNVSYAWDFGDGSGATGPTVSHVYPAIGAYTITVTATNSVNVVTATTTVDIYEAIISVAPPAVEATLQSGAKQYVPITISSSGASELTWDVHTVDQTFTDSSQSLYRVRTSDDLNGPDFQWVDISTTGTVIGGLSDDSVVGPRPIGFSFPYFDQVYTSFYVSSNGFIGFGPTNDYASLSNTSIPSPNTPNNMIAWLWDDLLPRTGVVRYQVVNGDLVIQFTNYGWYGSSYDGARMTTQVILKPSGDILLQYLSFTGNAPLANSTIGVENLDGTVGVQAAHNQAFAKNNLAVLFAYQPNWAQVSPESGSTPSNQTSVVTLTLDATGLISGTTYYADVVIENNDPLLPQVTVPITLHVTGIPRGIVSPAQLDFGTRYVGYPSSQQLLVGNLGNGALQVVGMGITNPAFSASPASFTVPISSSQAVTVSYLPTIPGPVSASLVITTNDPVTPVLTVALVGNAIMPPVINITPPSIEETLNSGTQREVVLTLANDGGSELTWDATNLVQNIGIVGGSSNAMYTQMVNDTQLGPVFSFTNLGNNWTYTTIQGYDLILVSESDNGVTTTEADALASFYASGKPVIMGMDDFDSLASSIRTTLWGIFGVSSASDGDFIFGSVSSHPVAQGISSIGSPGGDNDAFIANGAEWVVRGNDGRSYVLAYSGATRTVVMGENLSDWYTAQPQLLRNAIFWIGTGWLEAAPNSGVVPAGESIPLTVTLDATSLISGTYNSELSVQSNDPGRLHMSVPITLRVIGTPAGLITPNLLNFNDAFVGFTKTLQLQAVSNGTSDFKVLSVVDDHPDLSVAPTTLSVPPFLTQPLAVSYRPMALGNLTATITVTTNDANNPLFVIPVFGNAINPPQVSAAPISFNVTQDTGLITTRTLTIQNSGLGTLNFSLSISGGVVGVTPNSGTLIGPGQRAISVTFDTRTRGAGTYNGAINVISNDPATPTLVIPVTFQVILVPPEMPTGPNPQDGEINVRIDKQLRWTASPHATSYNLYLWRDGQPKPGTPTISGLSVARYTPPTLLLTGTVYHWQVVARNGVGDTPGPEWTFTTETLPDVRVTSVTVPPTGYSGQPAQFQWVVSNQGERGTTAATWYDHVYLSNSPIFNIGTATYLGRVTNPAYLGVGESYQNQGTFNLPQGVSGAYYVHVIADGNGHMRELVEDNNTGSSAAFTISLTPPPDLQVMGITAPANAFSGARVQMQWLVENTGGGGTIGTQWTDRLYLSADPTFNINDDLVLTSVAHNGALAGGERYTVTTDIDLPNALYGTFYLFVVTDLYDQVYEHSSEGNNTSAPSSPIEITLSPTPDLEVGQIVAPGTANSGTSINVSWMVDNNGAGPTIENYWYDRVYLSTSPTLNVGSDLLMGTYQHGGVLDAGLRYTNTQALQLPNGISGSYYIHIWTDYNNQVFEFNEDGNNVTTVPLTINLSPSPDLLVPVVSVPAGGNLPAGSTLQVTWSVYNAASPTPNTPWIDRIYLSTSPVWTGSTIVLGEFARSTPLATGARYTDTRTLVIPATLATGNYYVYVVTDATNVLYEHNGESNNVGRTASARIILEVPPTDIVIGNVSAPVNGVSGAPIDVMWQVTNTGSVATQISSWTDGLYLSSDSDLDPNTDPRLGTAVRTGTLAAGATYTRSLQVTLPQGISGQYRLFVRADIENQVNDNLRANNTIMVSPPISITLADSPDLQPTAIAPPGSGVAGQPVTVTWSVLNNGNAGTTHGWYDGVYLSSDATLGAGDIQLTSRPHSGGLTIGERYTVSLQVTLPGNLAGNHYLLVKTDSRNEIYEHNAEGNNIAAWPLTLNVPPPADLVVEGVTVPVSAVPGAAVLITWNLRNQGTSEASGTLCDAVYISADATWDIGDVSIGDHCRSVTLAPGQADKAEFEALMPDRKALVALGGGVSDELPGVTPGAYYAIVRADIRNQIVESNEGNNAGASEATISVDVEPLTLGVPDNDTLGAGVGRFYKVDVAGGETMLVRMDSSATSAANEMYIRYGNVPSRGVFDFNYTAPFAPDQEIVVPLTISGTYYIMVYGASVPSGTPNYSIVAEVLPFSVRAVDPGQVGNAGSVTLEVQGARFTSDTSFQLLAPGGATLSATQVSVYDFGTAYATFDLLGQPTGQYGIRASKPGGASTELANALTVVEGVGPRLEVTMSGPPSLRPNGTYLAHLNYANVGDADAAAPLLLLHSPTTTPMGLFPTLMSNTSVLQVMGISPQGPAGILRPGQRHSIPVYFESSTPAVNFRLQTMTDHDNQLIDWDALEANVRPVGIPDAEWAEGWANIQTRVGATWGDYVGTLARVASQLTQRGERVYDVRLLFEALFRQEFGYPTAVVAGQLVNNTTGQLMVNTTVVLRAEIDPDNFFVRQATTDAQGRFRFEELPAGSYEVAVDEYYFEPAAFYTVTNEADATGLVLYAIPRPESPEPPPPNVRYDSPQLIRAAGATHLVYVRDGAIYHASHNGTTWGPATAVPGAEGSEPQVRYAPNLIDGTTPGLFLSWEQGSGNDAIIMYAVGRQNGGVWEWSEPEPYFDGSVGSVNPAVSITSGGIPVVVWQMLDYANPEADADLYYDDAPVSSTTLRWSDLAGIIILDKEAHLDNGMVLPVGSAVGLTHSGEAVLLSPDAINGWSTAISINIIFEKGSNVPLPFIGGKNEVSILGGVAGRADAVGASVQGQVAAEVELMDGRFMTSSTVSVAGTWDLDKNVCRYIFKKVEVAGTIGLQGRIPLGGFDIFVVKVELGVQIGGQVSGVLVWRAGGGLLPDGEIKGLVSFGFYGKAKFTPFIEGDVAGTGNAEVTVSKDGVALSDVFFLFGAEIKVAWFKEKFEFRYPEPPPAKHYPTLDAALASIGAQGTYTLTRTIEPQLGTTTVYTATPMLSTIATDVVYDGPPVLAQGNDGLTYAFWTRESSHLSTTLGNTIVYATYDGSSWSAPQTLPGSLGFNRSLAVAKDSDGDLLLIWAHGDATGFTINSDPTAVFAAYDNVDVWYAQFSGGIWSAPAALTTLVGEDRNLSLNTAASGDLWASWIQFENQTDTLYATKWTGASWSTPLTVTTATIHEGATLQELGGQPTLVWVQGITDHEPNEDVSGGTQIYQSSFNGSGWSTPAVLGLTELLPTLKQSAVTQPMSNPFYELPIVPPSEVCDDNPDNDPPPDPPNPPDPNNPTYPPVNPNPPYPYDPPVIVSRDPNDIIGPAGYGDAKWVAASSTMDYMIRFENDENLATAPTQRVTIEQVLDSDLDPRRFRLGSFGFGDHIFQVPANRAFYQARLDVRQSLGLYVDVTAGIDVVTGRAFWIFQSIDPATGAPPTDATAGFLPPDVNEGEGQGYVTYQIRPKTTTDTGDVVDAEARIVFDDNDPIDTPPIFNTLDADAPSSLMMALPPETTGAEITLTWSITDGLTGSGAKDVDVYVSDNGAPFTLWRADVAETTAIFTGEAGHTYGFATVAEDHAGNRAAEKSAAEASTLVYIPGVPTQLELSASPSQIPPDGTSSSTITALVSDGHNVGVPGQTVFFTTTLGSLDVVSATTDASGVATATLTAGLISGQALVGGLSGLFVDVVVVQIADEPTATPTTTPTATATNTPTPTATATSTATPTATATGSTTPSATATATATNTPTATATGTMLTPSATATGTNTPTTTATGTTPTPSATATGSTTPTATGSTTPTVTTTQTTATATATGTVTETTATPTATGTTTTTTPTPTATIPIGLCYDLNLDGVVDVQDIVMVASPWQNAILYDVRVDVVLDGQIDVVDIMTVMSHFGRTCP